MDIVELEVSVALFLSNKIYIICNRATLAQLARAVDL